MAQQTELQVYDDYPKDEAKALIGNTIHYLHSEWKVLDLTYHHFVIERISDKWLNFVKPQYILEDLAKQAEAKELQKNNLLQKIFDEKGIAAMEHTYSSDGDGQQFGYAGELTTGLGRNAASIKQITILNASSNRNGSFEFGYTKGSSTYYHTYEKDPTKPYGVHVVDGHRGTIDFDKFTWIPKEEFKEFVEKQILKNLKKNIKIGDEVFYHENAKCDDETVSFTFWSADSNFAYKLRGNYKADRKSHYEVDEGNIKVQGVQNKKSGSAQSGSSRYGTKFTLSKTCEVKTKAEIFELIKGLVGDCAEQANEYLMNALKKSEVKEWV